MRQCPDRRVPNPIEHPVVEEGMGKGRREAGIGLDILQQAIDFGIGGVPGEAFEDDQRERMALERGRRTSARLAIRKPPDTGSLSSASAKGSSRVATIVLSPGSTSASSASRSSVSRASAADWVSKLSRTISRGAERNSSGIA